MRSILVILAALIVGLIAQSAQAGRGSVLQTDVSYDFAFGYDADDGVGVIDETEEGRSVYACAGGRVGMVVGSTGVVALHSVYEPDDPIGPSTLLLTLDGSEGVAGVTFSTFNRYLKAEVTSGGAGLVRGHCSNAMADASEATGGPPPAGTPSVFTFYETVEYDGDTSAWRLDEDTDMLRTNVNYFSEMGIPTDTKYLATINDQTVGVVQGYVRWFTAMGDAPGTDDARLSNRNDILASWSAITPSFGGRLQGKALGVFIRGLNTTTSHSCRIAAHINTAMAPGPFYPALDNTTTGPAADWAECTGSIEWGPASSNSGGVGDAGVIQRAGDHYMVPLTDCTCAFDECIIVVAVEDRDEGGGEDCDDIDDVDVTLVAGENPQ